jgi:rhodanese-related sulfurtransferase
MIPEITVEELSQKMKTQDKFVLLDVRELFELEQAKLVDDRLEVVPMSRLAREGVNALSDAALNQEGTLYVLCHHGSRSAQVTGWLAAQGWKNVFSVRGGIDAYAHKVDRSVGFY